MTFSLDLAAMELEALAANDQSKSELYASWKFIAGDANFRAMHLFRFRDVSQLVFCNIRLFAQFN